MRGVLDDSIDDCAAWRAAHDGAFREGRHEIFGATALDLVDHVCVRIFDQLAGGGEGLMLGDLSHVLFELHVKAVRAETTLHEPVDGQGDVRDLLRSGHRLVVIGLGWARVGIFFGQAGSGALEEFERALKLLDGASDDAALLIGLLFRHGGLSLI